MPNFEPNKWNTPDVQSVNNCYNYATDNRNAPQDGQPAPRPASPGRKEDVTAGIPKGAKVVSQTPDGHATVRVMLDFTCRGVKTVSILDGLKEPNAQGACDSGCWKVGYFVRRCTDEKSGDIHFVRQDGDGTWSHKPGTNAATQNQFNPQSGKYDGPKITDPSKDNVGQDYTFCGYLCCCPGTTVAMVEPQSSHEMAALSVATTLGDPNTVTLPYAPRELQAVWSALVAELASWWVEGFGPGALRYRLDGPFLPGDGPQTALITDRSVTVWD